MSEIKEIMSKFIDTKQRISELEKKHEKYRKFIEEYLSTNGLSTFSHRMGDDKYIVKKTVGTRQTVAKSDLPKDIWEKYAKTSTFITIRVDKEKKEKEKKIRKSI